MSNSPVYEGMSSKEIRAQKEQFRHENGRDWDCPECGGSACERYCDVYGERIPEHFHPQQTFSEILDGITRGAPPEEGDFNTALILSGRMTAQERRWLQEDLESVEPYDPSDDWGEEPYDEWEEGDPYLCTGCGEDVASCTCS